MAQIAAENNIAISTQDYVAARSDAFYYDARSPIFPTLPYYAPEPNNFA